MQLSDKKVNSHKVASMRKEIFSLASSIRAYAGNKRVADQLSKKAFPSVVPSPKKQAEQPIHVVFAKPKLLEATERAQAIANLAKSEHDTEKLSAYKGELMALHKAIKAAAPKSEFNKHKPL